MLSRRSMVLGTIAASGALVSSAFAIKAASFNLQSFLAAQKAGEPILVAIHASWRPTCQAQNPILSALMAEPKFKSLSYFVVDFDYQKTSVRYSGRAYNRPSSCSRALPRPAVASATPIARRSPRFWTRR